MKESVILAHAGQQSSFKRAIALEKSGQLKKYITTVYIKRKYLWITRVLGVLSHNEEKRAKGRCCTELPDNKVKQYNVLRNLFLVFLSRKPSLKQKYWVKNRLLSTKFAIKTAKYADRHKAKMLIMMGYAPFAAFDFFSERNSTIIKVFDMTSVSYNYELKTMTDEKQKLPLNWQKSVLVSDKKEEIERLMENIEKADFVFVSSSFAKKTLLLDHVPEAKIKVIKYGIEPVDVFPNRDYNFSNRPLRFLYVGQVSFEKGVLYLLEAMSHFTRDQVHLTVLGKNFMPEELISKYKDQVSFCDSVPHDDVAKYYLEADVFIFCTLFDSFGKVVGEALSYGLPVICTSSAGAADYIEDNYNGFIIPPSNVEETIKAIDFFVKNKNEIARLSKNAIITAHNQSWDSYYQQYSNTIDEILNDSRVPNYSIE